MKHLTIAVTPLRWSEPDTDAQYFDMGFAKQFVCGAE
jgi:hypothetical protein